MGKKQWAKYDADDKKKKTLVMIMVDIEKEQGTLQHEADIEWMATIKITRHGQMSDSVGLNQETVIQNDYGESIKKHNEEINSISKVDEGIKKSIDDLTIAMHDEMEMCQYVRRCLVKRSHVTWLVTAVPAHGGLVV